MEFYSSWFDKHNSITRKSFALKRTNQVRRNCKLYVDIQVKTAFKKHLIAIDYQQSQILNLPLLARYSPNTISDDARNTVETVEANSCQISVKI